MHDGQIVGNGGVIVRGTYKQAVRIAVRSRRKRCPAQLPAVVQLNVLLGLLERGAVITFCAAAALGLELQKQAVRAGVELVQYRCTIGHALGNHQRFVRPKVEAGVPGLVRHMDGFAADRVCSFFAQVVAACIHGCIVPVIRFGNNVVSACDPLGHGLGDAVGFLVNRGYRFFDRLELLFRAVKVIRNGRGGLFQTADFGADAVRLLADVGDIFFQALHRCCGGIILQLAVNGIIGSAGGGFLHVGRYRFGH